MGVAVQVYISVDMEGVAGIATRDQVIRGGHGYPRAQALMTAETNAAIEGAYAGGATAVLINDSHGTMDNLIHEDLDPRARLIFGSPKTDCMAEGVTGKHDLAIFLGYHAPAGGPGVLAHTFSAHFTEVRVNGQPVSEADVNLLQLAVAGVPLGLVTGDDVICDWVTERMPGVRTVEVKRAHGWTAADSLAPTVARDLIRDACAETVTNAHQLRKPTVPDRLVIEIDFPSLAAADLAQAIPGSDRTAATTVRMTAASVGDLVGFIVVSYQLTAASLREDQALLTRR